MPALRSRTTTDGRNMAGARALWRATGMTDDDFGKPIVAIANSFTQFVPGHVHLRNMGSLVADAIAEAGGVGREFNTIAVDDGIAMGHSGMLYSLPTWELIADSVEYMVEAHKADALVCISNCDKITPGMLLAAMRLNVPTVFVSGGPMESGTTVVSGGVARTGLDLITAMSASADESVTDDELGDIERSACPTCGSCSGMFTANSMNCLTEVIGLSLPGNGSWPPAMPARSCSKRRAAPWSTWPGATTRTTTRACCPARWPTAGPSPTPCWSTSPWAGRRTQSCTCSPPPSRAGSISTWPTSTSSAATPRASARWRPTAPTTSRTSTAPAASPPSWASCTAPACSTRPSTPCTPPTSRGGWPPGTSAPRNRRPRRSSCSTPPPAASARPRRSARPTGGRASTWTLKGRGLGKVCALITDGRFSGGTSGLSIGHISPEAAAEGAIGLVENGDSIIIDIPQRRITLDVDESTLVRRRADQDARGWQPVNRDRPISTSLAVFARLALSADKGAARDLGMLDR